MKRWNALFAVIVAAVLAQPAPAEDKRFPISNQWIRAEYIAGNGGAMAQFLTRGKGVLTSPDETRPAGHSLELFSGSPLNATEEAKRIPLPSLDRVSLDRKEIAATLKMEGQNDQFRMAKSIRVQDDIAMVVETTVIVNSSSETIRFTPALKTAWDVIPKLIESKPAGKLFLPYRPYSDEMNGIELFDENEKHKAQYQLMSGFNIIVAEHQQKEGGLNWTANRNWAAYHKEENNWIATLEHSIDGPDIQPATINRSLEIEPTRPNRPSAAILTQVLGEVALAPNETATIITKWSHSLCLPPILDVRDGIATMQPFGVMNHSLGYYVYGAFGIPREGALGLEYFDKDGASVIKRLNTMLCLNMKTQQPFSLLTLDQPTVITALDGTSSVLEKEGTGKTYLEWMREKSYKVCLYLVNKDQNKVIQTLGESVGPWELYQN